MKPRKVMVHLEMKSDRSIKLLKDKGVWQEVVANRIAGINIIHQITAQVVKGEK